MSALCPIAKPSTVSTARKIGNHSPYHDGSAFCCWYESLPCPSLCSHESRLVVARRDEARVFLHEFDHLEGTLLTDRAEPNGFMQIEHARDPDRGGRAELGALRRRRATLRPDSRIRRLRPAREAEVIAESNRRY